MNRFEQALRQHHTILIDGGLATELEARGQDLSGRLWSARLLRDDPGAIVEAHLAFLEAGARCIISASYQASREGFAAAGLDEAEADRLLLRSVELADEARRQFLRRHPGAPPVLVAASVGPYGAFLHDGSEYTGRYGLDEDGLAAFHAGRLRLLDRSGADVLACETVPSMAEARALARLLHSVQCPAWISFCCRDGRRLSDGSDIGEAARLFAGHPRVLALGVNCTPPGHVVELIGRIREAAPGKAVVVYPNSGERFDIGSGAWAGDAAPGGWGPAALAWRDAGACLIGGCCRVGPGQIEEMGRALAADGVD